MRFFRRAAKAPSSSVDEAAAYDWATKQTGWDPYQAKAMLDQQTQARRGKPVPPWAVP